MKNVMTLGLPRSLKMAALLTIMLVAPLAHANDWDKVDKAFEEAKEDTEKALEEAKLDTEKATDVAEEDIEKAYDKAKVDTQEVIDKNEPGTDRFLDRVQVNSERVIDDVKEFGEKVATEVKEELNSDSQNTEVTANTNETQLVPVVVATNSFMVFRGVEDLASFKENLSTTHHYYSINGESWSAPITLAKGTKLEVVETPVEDQQFATTLVDSLNATTDVVPAQTVVVPTPVEVPPAQTVVVPTPVEVPPAQTVVVPTPVEVAPAQTVVQAEIAPKQFCAKTTSFKIDNSTDIISFHKFSECVVTETP